MRQGGLILAAGRMRSKKKNDPPPQRNPAAPKTRQNPQQPGDRDHFEACCDKTRPMR